MHCGLSPLSMHTKLYNAYYIPCLAASFPYSIPKISILEHDVFCSSDYLCTWMMPNQKKIFIFLSQQLSGNINLMASFWGKLIADLNLRCLHHVLTFWVSNPYRPDTISGLVERCTTELAFSVNFLLFTGSDLIFEYLC